MCPRVEVLKLKNASEFLGGFVKNTDGWDPYPVSSVVGLKQSPRICIFINSQVLMLLIQGPQFVKHCSGEEGETPLTKSIAAVQ